MGGAEQDRARLGMQELGWAGKPDVVVVGMHGGFAGDLRGIQKGFVPVWGGFMRIGCDRHLGICGIAGGFKRVNSPLL